MVKGYEELVGAFDKGARFRPERVETRSALGEGSDARVHIDGREYPLFDLSLTGVSFFAPSDRDWKPDHAQEIRVLVYDQEVFQGMARIARVAKTRRGVRVGVSLVDGMLDISGIRAADLDIKFSNDLDHGPRQLLSHVPPDYADVVHKATFFLQYYKQRIDAKEARILEAPDHAERIDEACHRLYESLHPRWITFRESASESATKFMDDELTLSAAKKFTEISILPYLGLCPMIDRSYNKPLGYPGDFEAMMYTYEDGFRGDSLFARVFHRMAINHPLAQGIRSRCEMVADLVVREYERHVANQNLPFTVTSLGCGPAREVHLVNERLKSTPNPIVWTLIDQEDKALEIAFEDNYRSVLDRKLDVKLRCINLSFRQLGSNPAAIAKNGFQNFIFSLGLFDYLKNETAQLLVAGMYSLLQPGGTLAIGNARGPCSTFWEPEFVTDWTLLYRSRDEMLQMSTSLPANAIREIVQDPSGAYYFLVIRKPAVDETAK